MPAKVQNSVNNQCTRYIKHDANNSKEPLHATIVTTPLDLIHIDFTSIEVSRDDALHKTPQNSECEHPK